MCVCVCVCVHIHTHTYKRNKGNITVDVFHSHFESSQEIQLLETLILLEVMSLQGLSPPQRLGPQNLMSYTPWEESQGASHESFGLVSAVFQLSTA